MTNLPSVQRKANAKSLAIPEQCTWNGCQGQDNPAREEASGAVIQAIKVSLGRAKRVKVGIVKGEKHDTNA